jgi:hypothetical protein
LQPIRINFKSKGRIFNLILGLVWIGLGTSRMIFEDDYDWVSYVFIITGLLYFSVFYSQYKRNYFLITDGFIIKKFDFWSKKMNLSEIKAIRKFACDYKLRTEHDELIINTQLIEQNDLETLNKVL